MASAHPQLLVSLMKNIMWFNEITKASIPEAGGKGANLGEMSRAGFPIPPGFVVTSAAYFYFLEQNAIAPFIKDMTEDLDVEDSDKLNKASETIKNKILSGGIPSALRNEIMSAYKALAKGKDVFVAVRSSATAEDLPEASFAGQQSTYLNVHGAESVVQAVKECWASLFEARAIYYRTTNHFDHLKVGLAAVVQEMVQSEVAGVMFTVDPVTQDTDKISIEGAYGLGELVVSGSVTPDSYIYSKKAGAIVQKEIVKQTWMITKVNDENVHANVPEDMQDKQKLPDPQVVALAKIGKKIEEHYGKPQDTEWAYSSGKMYIVQARPITTLTKAAMATSIADIKSVGMDDQPQTQAIQARPQSMPQAQPQKYSQPMPQQQKYPQPMQQAAKSEQQSAPQQQAASMQQAGSQPVSQALPSSQPSASYSSQQPSGGGSMISVSNAKMILRGLAASPGVGRGPVKYIATPKEINQMVAGSVLVTDMTTPDFVPAMKKSVAIVTNTGGRTCHAAIVSRELGIPCIVGAKGATDMLKDGMVITVDAVHGNVYDGEVDLGEVGRKHEETVAAVQIAAPITGTKIYVNLAEVELADKVAALPCDGIGLLRAEFMIAAIGEHPRKIISEGRQQEFINNLADKLRTFASAFYPRPVVYRATDFKTNEYRNLKGGEQYEPQESNPMMGYRGCARYIAEPDVFKLELEAIKKVRDEFGMKNLWLMIPFVRRIGEIRAVKDILKEVGIHRTRDFRLWIMVEVPSTVFLIDDFCKEGIDGVSIGSNDLTQLILGIDRDNSTLAEGFDERNAAVLSAIETVVRVCNKNGVTCSLCGQGPSVYPDFAEKLVEFGVTSMSVNPDAVERTRRIVASAEQKILLSRLAKLTESEQKKHVAGNDD
jgi:pyruvate,water dikinase